LVDHVTLWPLIAFPYWSFTVAWSVTVDPATTDAEGGETATVVTTGGAALTVIVAEPDLPELVAVIFAVPAATPVTTPAEFTVAAEALSVDHVTVCPDIALPF
jgi:hypothetical protein